MLLDLCAILNGQILYLYLSTTSTTRPVPLCLNHLFALNPASKLTCLGLANILFPPKSLWFLYSETLPQHPTMAEETRWCRICRKEKPNDAFRAPEGAGKDFYKMCEPCRTKYRDVRVSHAQMGKRILSRIRSRLKRHRYRELKGRTQTGDELGRIIRSQHLKLAPTYPTQRRELPLKPPVPHNLPPCPSSRIVCT